MTKTADRRNNRPPRRTNPYKFYAVAIVVFVSSIGLGLWSSFDVAPLYAAFIGINAGAFFFMGLDKSLARSASTRTPEILLYLLALAGGSPGILLGIHLFRHKTQKASFQFVLLLIIIAQLFIVRALGVDLSPTQ